MLPAPSGYWKFDGDLLDSSGQGRDLVIGLGGYSFPVAKHGQGFRGTAGIWPQPFIDGNVNSASFAVALWARTGADLTKKSYVKLRSADGSYDQLTVQVECFTAKHPRITFTVRDGSGQAAVVVNPSPALDGWNHYCVVSDEGLLHVCFNGVLMASGSTENLGDVPFDAAGSLAVLAAVNPFGVDDLAVWNCALTDEQVSEIATAPGDLSTLL